MGPRFRGDDGFGGGDDGLGGTAFYPEVVPDPCFLIPGSSQFLNPEP